MATPFEPRTPDYAERVRSSFARQSAMQTLGATLAEVQHGDGVDATLRVPESRAAALVARINDAGQGRVEWRNAEDGASG